MMMNSVKNYDKEYIKNLDKVVPQARKDNYIFFPSMVAVNVRAHNEIDPYSAYQDGPEYYDEDTDDFLDDDDYFDDDDDEDDDL